MRRREFITLIGGGAATWPVMARAQQPAMPVIGLLVPFSPEPTAPFLAALREGLSEAGFIERRNVAIEARYAQNDIGRLPELAVDLVRRRVAVIATLGGPAAVRAARAASATIPIVFEVGVDPVRAGLVASLNRPGGNATGISFLSSESETKRLGFLRALLPSAKRFAMLVGSVVLSDVVANINDEIRETAATIGVQIEILNASNIQEIDAAFVNLVQKQADALLVRTSPLYIDRGVQIATLAARHAVPTVHFLRQFAAVGGLMSYGANYPDQVRQVGVYVGRILKGEKPADLPIIQPTKFEFVINLQTARALNIEVPPSLLATADEVIE
jgi:putative tryptophan/tyrosine transport system substrate-binding protein